MFTACKILTHHDATRGTGRHQNITNWDQLRLPCLACRNIHLILTSCHIQNIVTQNIKYHILIYFRGIILGKSVGERHFVGLRQRGDPSDGLLSRHHVLLLWLEPEDSMYPLIILQISHLRPVLLDQRGEEEEELGLGQGLAQTLPLANREGNEVLVPLDISRLIQEPLRPEHLSITPVVTWQVMGNIFDKLAFLSHLSISQ